MNRPGLFDDILELTSEHFVLVLVSMAIAVLIGIPLGILLTRRPPLQGWVLGVANVAIHLPLKARRGRF